jgi:hypothetical protein
MDSVGALSNEKDKSWIENIHVEGGGKLALYVHDSAQATRREFVELESEKSGTIKVERNASMSRPFKELCNPSSHLFNPAQMVSFHLPFLLIERLTVTLVIVCRN